MFFSAFERMVAMRYLGARRQEGFASLVAVFSLVGIFLGVFTLIVVMAVMNGFRQELMSTILGVNGHLTLYPVATGQIDDFDAIDDKVSAMDGVVTATPQIQAQAMITSEGTALGAAVRGMRPEDMRKRKMIADNIIAGSLDDFAGEDVILLGSGLARTLGRTVGDHVTLVTPRGNVTVMGTVPRMKAYRIVGIFQIGMSQYDSNFAYLPLEAAQLYFRLPNAVNAIEVFAKNSDMVPRLRREIADSFGRELRSVDLLQSNSSFINAIQVERNVMFLILSLIILVAAFNILSGQYMLVKSKGRDIAILRTMGANRSTILKIFFLSGAVIGVFGTLLGTAGGIAFAANIETIRQWLQALLDVELFSAEIYFFARMPAEIDAVEVVQVVFMALLWSFLAPIYPAWRAARVDPVEALRYE